MLRPTMAAGASETINIQPDQRFPMVILKQRAHARGTWLRRQKWVEKARAWSGGPEKDEKRARLRTMETFFSCLPDDKFHPFVVSHPEQARIICLYIRSRMRHPWNMLGNMRVRLLLGKLSVFSSCIRLFLAQMSFVKTGCLSFCTPCI